MRKMRQISVKKSVLVTTIVLLLLGCRSDANGGIASYSFECINEDNQPFFEAVGHTFLVPKGFQIDEFNEKSLVFVTTSPPLGDSQMEIQTIIIRYGAVDEQLHNDWTLASRADDSGLKFDVKINTQNHAYGSKSYWLAFVGQGQQILIYSLVPIEWQSFLKCLTS